MHPTQHASRVLPSAQRRAATVAAVAVGLYMALASAGCGGSDSADEQMATLVHWNHVAIDASGRDHTPVSAAARLAYVEDGAPLEADHRFGEQLGPARAARAMAIVHMAMFEAVNAIVGGYESAVNLARPDGNVSVEAAIAAAAHTTLIQLYPSQADIFDEQLAEDVAVFGDSQAVHDGRAVGGYAAVAVLNLRENDGSDHEEPVYGVRYTPGAAPGNWRQDPISMHPLALGANWSRVMPFVMTSADQFRVPPPPALDSPAYAAAFDEVKRLGGDGLTTATERTEEQTFLGTYWAYDGTPSLCAPPRLYNQIAMEIAAARRTSAVETGRLLALVNIAMADAAIAAWESKYHWAFWRPITGIREADPSTGDTGEGDGNPATEGDETFTPLGAPASNLTGPNFTPPFPAYPSGHAVFGGALFEVLREFYETDDIAFTLVSDEFNGVTRDNQGEVRPLRPRSFQSLSEAEEENGQSRIYLGIHWSFDKTEGIAQGNKVGRYVFENLYRRVR